MKKNIRYKVKIYQNDELITIAVEDVKSKIKQVKSYQKGSLINIEVNINLFLASEIERLKNKIKDMISNNKWLKAYNKL